MYRNNPINAYKAEEKRHLSGRETEARVLTEGAMKLKQIQQNWDAPDRDKRLHEALRYNQRIWSIFQSELARPDNPMPKKLREDLLSLSVFIDRRMFEVMAFPESSKLDIVIKINHNIAAGLRSAPAQEQSTGNKKTEGQQETQQTGEMIPASDIRGSASEKILNHSKMSIPQAYAASGAAY